MRFAGSRAATEKLGFPHVYLFGFRCSNMEISGLTATPSPSGGDLVTEIVDSAAGVVLTRNQNTTS